MAENGIKIDGKHYAIPSSLRIGETRTIKRVTGLNPPEFMLALSKLNETQDPDVGAAMVWWIVHREDPSFTIDQVDALEWGALEGEGGEPVAVDPKDSSAITASSPTSAVESSSTSAVDAGGSMRANGGGLALAHSGLGT